MESLAQTTSDSQRLRIAVQKSGRLSEKSFRLLDRCGLSFPWESQKLILKSETFPIDVMKVRDDDIPGYVADGVCDLGIVGQNVISEKSFEIHNPPVPLLQLGFGTCRLAIAVPKELAFSGLNDLSGLRIATSYPHVLGHYLEQQGISAQVLVIHGSVEIAPTLKIADAICDLVSTGGTLRSHGLVEVATILHSQSVLLKATELGSEKETLIARILARVRGVLKADQTKYIMMNAPRSAIETIKGILPGMEDPSIIPLGTDSAKVAIHAVAHETVFWETMERLKAAGASSILVLPIEKIIE